MCRKKEEAVDCIHNCSSCRDFRMHILLWMDKISEKRYVVDVFFLCTKLDARSL
jgi:hypothetical protein